MKVFYEKLAGGHSAAAALRQAQEAIARQEATAHPFYWGAFVVVGNGDITVELDPSVVGRGLILFVVIGVLAVVLGVVLAVRLRGRRAENKKSL